VSSSNRGYISEINNLVNQKVIVQTKDKATYVGVLKGINENLNLILNDAVYETKKFYKILISGDLVNYITLGDIPFDIHGLADELIRVFKAENVRIHDDSNTILVMDRFRVSDQGVTGEGVVADRVRTIWNEYKKRQNPTP
jgi:small nuclear ribonucleoprotein (snRNP)-like protein